MSELLRVEQLKKYFPTAHGMLHAVDNVNFSIGEGKTLGIVGESGCGKSTLGRLVVHLLSATDGTIRFQGEDITSPSKERMKQLRRQMQMIFQDPYASLNPRMTTSQSIAEPLKIFKMCSGAAALDEKVGELMRTVGLAARFKDAYPHELDGGRRQRIGIARALASSPKFIVCDEPVSALDVSIQAQILNLLRDLQQERGLTYIFITHDLSVVKHISDEICVMYLGQIVESCAADELFAHPVHPYTKGLLSAIPRTNAFKEKKQILLKGEITTPIDPPEGCRFAARCEYATDRCRTETPALREVAEGHCCACHLV